MSPDTGFGRMMAIHHLRETDLMTEEITGRPKFPHLDNLEKVLVSFPDYANRDFTVTEKVHGFNARVGRDPQGVLWYGGRNEDFDASDPKGPGLSGFREYAVETFAGLPPGVTLYGEWAGRGVQKGIDYGDKRFYLFGERLAGSPVRGDQATLDQHMYLGVATVPVISQGHYGLDLDVLDKLRQGESIIAPGQPIEGVVLWPIEPFFNGHGHQIIAKFKSPQFAEVTSARERRAPLDLTNVNAFVEEYATAERLAHVIVAFLEHEQSEHEGALGVTETDILIDPRFTGDILKGMYQDVVRESGDDFAALSEDDQKLVGKALNRLVKPLLDAERLRVAAAAVA